MTESQTQERVQITPLGGLGEVGRNMMLLEYKRKILIIDVGFGMPGEDLPGIDHTIPNISPLKGREKDIVGIVITHGHYDHIGAIPYIVPNIGNPPIYTGALGRAIILKRQDDFKGQPKLNIITIRNRQKFTLGPFKIETFQQNHNIPDNYGLLIRTPVGNILHTSDFKFDDDPVNETPTDYKLLEQIGKEKILLLMSDSTNAEQPDHSLSERVIMGNLDKIFKEAKGRIISATFASLINRVQQIITLSEKYGRNVALEGYSMKTNVEITQKIGYMKIKKGTLLKTKDIMKRPDSKITIMGTGAQGEERAVMMRIANGEHPNIKIQKGDTLIFSSSVIPGNERSVQFVKDKLYRQGAEVFHYKMMDIHASGHAGQEELRKIIKLIKPQCFIPIHGQFSMLYTHSKLAEQTGIPVKNIATIENGQIVNVTKQGISIDKKTTSVPVVLVDGLGVGDIGEVVLRDRQNLSAEGMFVVIAVVDRKTGRVKGSPDIISRGFIYLKESKTLLREVRKRVIQSINKSSSSNRAVNWVNVREDMKKNVSDYLFEKTERKPMVLPVIIEV
ncbi:MAG: ribonuclease J [Patescibacteria group bacterium]|nr:ribonuclease J [Patescibacteria group bacterium]